MLSNSKAQREFIESRAQKSGLQNVTVFTGDVAVFESEAFGGRFDRVISIGIYIFIVMRSLSSHTNICLA